MSSKLWESFLRDDVESFRRFLATASYTSGGARTAGPGGSASFAVGSSPGTVTGSSPGFSSRSKKFGGTSPGTPLADRSSGPRPGRTLSREELNARDQYGRTLLHHVASSPKPTAVDFALALLEIPFLDIYAQDWESGWTALHRALYAGNATIAQALMARDARDATDFSKIGTPGHSSGGLIKIKDREGYSPFDVYMATISSRDLKQISLSAIEHDPLLADVDNQDDLSSVSSNDEAYDDEGLLARGIVKPRTNLLCDEVFTFGSNKNLNLGVGDQDDRQFPERITLKRPEHLLHRFYHESLGRPDDHHQEPTHMPDLPALIRNKPVKYLDIVMSKLHTAILTDDPESNLFMCGFGPGGRLGTGDESTRFSFVCIETGGLANKKVVSVALGQDHTIAITEHGEIFSWGSNKFGQLGYSLPRTNNRDDVPVQTSPRQIFNTFKKEAILGAAASGVHSVVFSNSGLYTFGKNEGQLGFVDSDARALEIQTTPRRVGASLFSAPIQSVSAIDNATTVLLQNHEVWVFSQYGYLKLVFPLDNSSRFIRDSFMATRYSTSVNKIIKVRSGGNTVCALSSFGEVYTVQVNKTENPPSSTSTTNPSKIRNSLASPVRVWSVKKSHMAVKDVDVGQDGSIIICTASGSAWRKEKRGKTKNGESKDYKFARVPGLSRVVGVCSNSFGAFAAAQRDCNVTKEQISVESSALWKDLLPLSPFNQLQSMANSSELKGLGDGFLDLGSAAAIKTVLMSAPDVEPYFQHSKPELPAGTVFLMTTTSDIRTPVHEFTLAGRSPVLRKAFHDFRNARPVTIPDVVIDHYEGQTRVLLPGVDILTVLNIAFFAYTDSVLDVWQQARSTPDRATRYRQVRTEVMRIATHLGLPVLERAARLMIEPTRTLKADMARAIEDPTFFESGDVVIELNGDTVRAHSQLICQRSLFFDVLFHGRAGGKWLEARRKRPNDEIHIDLRHIERPIFDFVVRYMYADVDDNLFDEVRSKDLEDFIDLVLDVAFVANELMIDRLAQICQKMLGRFVNTRNVCSLLNSVAPCLISEFKDAALEYICLNLEDLIANRFLGDLDDPLLGALDAVCHENQLSSFPVSRGRASDEYIFEKYPELAALIEGDRKQRIDSIRLRARLNRFDSSEGRARPANTDKTPGPPSLQKDKLTPAKESPVAAKSPLLKSKHSTSDLMFQMDDEYLLSPGDTSKGKGAIRGKSETEETRAYMDSPSLRPTLADGESFVGQSYLDEQMASPQDTVLAQSPSETRAAALQKKQLGSATPPGTAPVPWNASVVSSSRKNLKDIMDEASEKQVSNLSLGMSSARRTSSTNNTPKLSQKERKKMQQQQMQEMLTTQQKAKEAPSNPWKLPPTPSKTGPSGVNGHDKPSEEAKTPQPKPSMTLRQTVAGTPPPQKAQSSATPTPVPIQKRSISGSSQPQTQTPPRPSLPGPSVTAPAPGPAPSTSPNHSTPAPPQPSVQSIRHIPRPDLTQPTFHSPTATSNSTSLATILLQQQTEKDEIREAATAKHNLEDIQLEQQFQEWWDKESRRVQGLPTEREDVGHANNKGGGRGNRDKVQGQSQRSNKRRGGGKNNTPNNNSGQSNATAAGVSALSQQLTPHHGLNQRQPQEQKQKQKQGQGHGHGQGQENAQKKGAPPKRKSSGMGTHPDATSSSPAVNGSANARRGGGSGGRGGGHGHRGRGH